MCLLGKPFVFRDAYSWKGSLPPYLDNCIVLSFDDDYIINGKSERTPQYTAFVVLFPALIHCNPPSYIYIYTWRMFYPVTFPDERCCCNSGATLPSSPKKASSRRRKRANSEDQRRPHYGGRRGRPFILHPLRDSLPCPISPSPDAPRPPPLLHPREQPFPPSPSAPTTAAAVGGRRRGQGPPPLVTSPQRGRSVGRSEGVSGTGRAGRTDGGSHTAGGGGGGGPGLRHVERGGEKALLRSSRARRERESSSLSVRAGNECSAPLPEGGRGKYVSGTLVCTHLLERRRRRSRSSRRKP